MSLSGSGVEAPSLPFKAQENLQEQEYEITALTEIIGDEEKFCPLKFSSKPFIILNNSGCQYSEFKTIAEFENLSRSIFFETNLFPDQTKLDKTRKTDTENTKTRYKNGGTIRVCPDLDYSLNTVEHISEGVNIRCRTLIKQTEIGGAEGMPSMENLCQSLEMHYPKFEVKEHS